MSCVWEIYGEEKVMDESTKRTREHLKNLSSVKDLEDIINITLLTPEEIEILTMIYRQGKTLDYIADTMGLSIGSVKKKHRKILLKVGKAIGGLEPW